MKTKTGWLIVILISSVQLALLLIAVISLFTWFVDQTEETVSVQACTDNMVISQQLVTSLESLKSRPARRRFDSGSPKPGSNCRISALSA